MKIKTKVYFKEYARLLYSLAYEKTILRLLLLVAFLILLWIIFFNLNVFDLPKPLIYQYVTLILIAVVQPLFKIVEKRKWFLLYQNNLSAILIPKKDMTALDINNFKKILKGVKEVPIELLKA